MGNRQKKVHEIYHKKTRYQKKFIGEKNFTYRILIPILKKNISKNKNVLDIGCGAGTLNFYISSICKSVTGVDISEKAIKSCKESAKILGLKNTNFKVLDFPDKSLSEKFDVVIFTEVIEHLPDDRTALQKIYKMLNKEGVMILSTPSKNAPLFRLGLLKDFDKKVGHLRRYEEKELLEMIKNEGFKILETKKVEGIIRNFLFTNHYAGKLVRFIKFFISDIVTFSDNATVPFFGESNYIVVARKSKS